MIFIQSQFYAGDSGSVSHKNVDQTSSSRLSATRLVAKAWPGRSRPRFLEYVDGAGYSASLNADLRSLLSFSDTAGFFQVRTAPIRLRRELQQIGFLTPLEIGHSILRTGGVQADVVSLLESEGYSPTEMKRVLKVSQEMGIVTLRRGRFDISRKFLPTVRRHLLLDFIACEGVGYPSLNGVTGVALVPGYGRFHGLALSELEKRIRQSMRSVWPKGFMVDLQQLCESGMVVLR